MLWISQPYRLVLRISRLTQIVLLISLSQCRLFWIQMILPEMEMSSVINFNGFLLLKKPTLLIDELVSWRDFNKTAYYS
jgi:hypothetical protein